MKRILKELAVGNVIWKSSFQLRIIQYRKIYYWHIVTELNHISHFIQEKVMTNCDNPSVIFLKYFFGSQISKMNNTICIILLLLLLVCYFCKWYCLHRIILWVPYLTYHRSKHIIIIISIIFVTIIIIIISRALLASLAALFASFTMDVRVLPTLSNQRCLLAPEGPCCSFKGQKPCTEQLPISKNTFIMLQACICKHRWRVGGRLGKLRAFTCRAHIAKVTAIARVEKLL